MSPHPTRIFLSWSPSLTSPRRITNGSYTGRKPSGPEKTPMLSAQAQRPCSCVASTSILSGGDQRLPSIA